MTAPFKKGLAAISLTLKEAQPSVVSHEVHSRLGSLKIDENPQICLLYRSDHHDSHVGYQHQQTPQLRPQQCHEHLKALRYNSPTMKPEMPCRVLE
jgi:hypothetical protein